MVALVVSLAFVLLVLALMRVLLLIKEDSQLVTHSIVQTEQRVVVLVARHGRRDRRRLLRLAWHLRA